MAQNRDIPVSGLQGKSSLLLVVLTFFILSDISGQEVSEAAGKNSFSTASGIAWYATLPAEGGKKKRSILKRVSDIILGPEEPLFSRPVSITATDSNNILVADQGYGEVVLTGIDNPSSNNYFDAREAKAPSITGICSIPDETILFTDSYTNNIYIKRGTERYRVFNDSLTLEQPTGIAWSPVNNEIWVLETKGHRISLLDSHGSRIGIIGSRGSGDGQFNYPTHIWIDESGMAYIVDAMNYRVQIFDSHGKFVSSFGEQGDATGYFARSKGIATDSRGNIYIADALFNSIQVFDRDGNFLSYFGTQGNRNGQFWMPGGIYIDKNDFLYIADSYNSRIQIFKITGK